MKLRLSHDQDCHKLLELHLKAFGNEEGPAIQKLIEDFHSYPGDGETLSLLAHEEEELLGHVIFSRLSIKDSDELVFILAPLGVHPAHQKKGIGSALVREGLRRLRSQMVSVFVVYGDPNYYGRFGFKEADPAIWVPPHQLQFPHGWTVLEDEPKKERSELMLLSCLSPLDHAEYW